jgi:putative Mg2+ transporter-C (MgtC) family protein
VIVVAAIDDSLHVAVALRLFMALIFGGAIGLERSYHGRPAGFRTHALVCLSTSLLMLISAFEDAWFTLGATGRTTTLDPTRMAQGIMTGIGFLGAGAIIKEGLTVRGLTTAASIWITAAIGVMIGIGFFFPATLAVALTLGTLSVFRWIERQVPAEFYAQFVVRFQRDAILPEAQMREMIRQHGFTIANLSYRLDRADDFFEYRMVIRTDRADNARAFSETLSTIDTVKEFRLSSTVD